MDFKRRQNITEMVSMSIVTVNRAFFWIIDLCELKWIFGDPAWMVGGPRSIVLHNFSISNTRGLLSSNRSKEYCKIHFSLRSKLKCIFGEERRINHHFAKNIKIDAFLGSYWSNNSHVLASFGSLKRCSFRTNTNLEMGQSTIYTYVSFISGK